MCYFIVRLPLDVGFEIDLEADAIVWCSDIDRVDAWGLIAEFWKPLIVISTFGLCYMLNIWGLIVYEDLVWISHIYDLYSDFN
jgi:hypothetical protein